MWRFLTVYDRFAILLQVKIAIVKSGSLFKLVVLLRSDRYGDLDMPTAIRRNYDSIDVAKFVLSIFVVVIHIHPFEAYTVFLRPVLRTAVPLFFLISSYFFFVRHKDLPTLDDRVAHLEKYVSRNLKLYLFWMIVLLVPTIKYRQWFANGFFNGVCLWFRAFFTDSTFIASWFIMAAVIATIIITISSRYISNKVLLLFSLAPFCICCLLCNYRNTTFTQAHMGSIMSTGINFTSYWVALFWVVTGKILAEKSFEKSFSQRGLLLLSALGLTVLYAEQALVTSRGWAVADDCYFALPLLCIPVFLLLLSCDIQVGCARFLRSASTVTFCLHATLQYVLRDCFGCNASSNMMLIIVLMSSWGLTYLILKLERMPNLCWLKYSH